MIRLKLYVFVNDDLLGIGMRLSAVAAAVLGLLDRLLATQPPLFRRMFLDL